MKMYLSAVILFFVIGSVVGFAARRFVSAAEAAEPEGCVTAQERSHDPHYCLCMMVRRDRQYCASFR